MADKTEVKALMLYESEVMLIILEAMNGDGPHPLREKGVEAADIINELHLDEDFGEMLQEAARNIMHYFARAAHEAGLSPDRSATLLAGGGHA